MTSRDAGQVAELIGTCPRALARGTVAVMARTLLTGPTWATLPVVLLIVAVVAVILPQVR
jgi:hypothetical protein